MGFSIRNLFCCLSKDERKLLREQLREKQNKEALAFIEQWGEIVNLRLVPNSNGVVRLGYPTTTYLSGYIEEKPASDMKNSPVFIKATRDALLLQRQESKRSPDWEEATHAWIAKMLTQFGEFPETVLVSDSLLQKIYLRVQQQGAIAGPSGNQIVYTNYMGRTIRFTTPPPTPVAVKGKKK